MAVVLNAQTTPVTSDPVRVPVFRHTVTAKVVGTGSVAATIEMQGGNGNDVWLPLATLTLSGTDVAKEGYAGSANWPYVRAVLQSISGTGAKVTITVGD